MTSFAAKTSNGTDTVCVRTIHQNVKLMLTELGLAEFPTYHDCLSRVTCTPPLPECYLDECESWNCAIQGDRAGLAEFPTYHDCLSRVTCTPPLPECYLDECESWNCAIQGDRAGLAEFPTYHDCLSRVTCAPPSPECYLDECESCPGIVPLRDELLSVLDESDIDQVIYKQWVSTDRSTLETHCTSADECGFILRKAGAPASTLIHSQATSFLLLAAQV